jgi:endonuclease/exonuclease/phosphatase (EEP) superfamily protein YafD
VINRASATLLNPEPQEQLQLERQKQMTTDTLELPLKKKRREWATALVCLCASIFGLMLSRAGLIWPDFDVFSQFTLQFAFATASFVLALLFVRRMVTTAALVVLILFCFAYGLWPRINGLPAIRTVDDKAQSIRIAQFNVFKNNLDVAVVTAGIRLLDADIVSLNEVKDIAMKQALQKLFPYYSECKPGYCDSMILSRFPLQTIPVDQSPSYWTYLRAEADAPGGKINILSLHFSRFPLSRLQLTQAQEFAASAGDTTKPVIVMGDFNSTSQSRVLETALSPLALNRLSGLPSWPTWLVAPQLAIDHIFVSPEFEQVGSTHLGDPFGSDHFPIIADIRRKP